MPESIQPTNLRYSIFRSKSRRTRDQWFFRIQSRNGNIIASSEGYKRRANALKTLLLLAPPSAKVEVLA